MSGERVHRMTKKYLLVVSLILLKRVGGVDAAASVQDDYKYLYNYLTGTGVHNFSESVTIGFLGAYGQAQVVLGALPLAIEAINQNKELLPGRTLSYVAADIGSNPTLAASAIRVMTKMRDNGTIAFIGPDDTCFPEALVAAAWNLPMISYKCSDTRVSDKRQYYTFARTLPPSSKVSKSVVSLLIAFNWRKFVVVFGSHPASGSEVKEAIKELSEANGLIVTDTKQYSDYIPRHIDQMDLIVSDTYKRTRVYVFVGEHIALVDFVKCLQRRKLLDSGDYVVISVDDEIYDPNRRIRIIQRDYLDPFLSETWGNLSDYMGFRSVLKLTPSHPRNPRYKKICEQIKLSSAQPPFCVPYHSKIFDSISVPIQAAYLYDAVMIYARALTEIFASNEDPRNGTAILQRIVNRSYQSVQGYDVFIDGNGDAEGNFTVVALLDDQEMNGTLRMSMQPVGYFQYNGSNSPLSIPEFKYLDPDRPIQWVGGRQPKAEPDCGFKGEKCIYKTDWRLVVGILFVSIIFLIGGLFVLKHYRYEQKLACLLWKIDMKDVTIIPTETTETTTKNMIQVCRHSVFQAPTGSIAEMSETSPKRAYTRIGLYKGNIVAIKRINKKSVDLTRSIRKELKQIREVRHENLIPFVGACVDHGQVAILTAYCARGSLEDVLANEDLHLDNMFVSSLVTDVLKGMIYLHDSVIISHGNLRSSNCLIDSRWVLQITDFGLTEFRAGEVSEPQPEGNAVALPAGSATQGARWITGSSKALRRALYRAPELLRETIPCPRGTQKGDVYAFGLLLYEIMGRAGPWGNVELPPEEIINEVKKEQAVPFRPDLDQLGADEYITKCIKMCWHEEPDQRPDIRYCRVILKEMQAGLKANIFDNMLAIMEKYAYNLEGLVQERTNQLTEEKKKTDALLHRMLPKTVADALKRGDRVEAETFDCVTIYFSDIVGFTELSAISTPLQVIDLLNDLYTCFDSIISHYDVYKVETIGDAYMVVSGLPVRNGDRHAGEIASMALHLLSKIKKFEIKHRSGELLQLRIGIHSGHCVAGVVGLKMPRYCLFGDTVNTASRMESSGESFKIHISQATYMLLQRLGGYRFEERGLIPIKGKGEMRTYWLIGEDQAQRLARIREEMLGSSLFSSISSDHLSETPDLIRRPGLPPICSLMELHERARKACSSLQLTPSKYAMIQATVWRHLHYHRSVASRGICMYAGLIIDMYYKFIQPVVTYPERVLDLSPYQNNNDFPRITQLVKMFVLHFDRVSELPINKSVYISGCKAIDLLDCAQEADKSVVYQKITDDTLDYKVSYYFPHGWLIALPIKENHAKSWSERMRLLYMRLRRIVTSHTHHHLEYANYRRELALRPVHNLRIKKPVNSVYTGYGEVGDRFYYYGTMNEGAYFNKFDSFAVEMNINVQSSDDEPYPPLVGLHVIIELKCPMQLAPRAVLKSERYEPDPLYRFINSLDGKEGKEEDITRQQFEMSISFHYPGGVYPCLPTTYTMEVLGTDR